jgi:hypothetical protein
LKWSLDAKPHQIHIASHDYLQYERHAYHCIAAFNGVIEPQQDSHLHWHIILYSNALSPDLLEKTVASPTELQTQVAQMLDSITCITLPPKIHQLYNDILASIEYGSKRLQGANMKIPDASFNFIVFVHIGMKKSLLTGMHGHGFCCKKWGKEKYMCYLVFKQGLHKWKTCPLLILLFKSENIANKQCADLQAYNPLEKRYCCNVECTKQCFGWCT